MKLKLLTLLLTVGLLTFGTNVNAVDEKLDASKMTETEKAQAQLEAQGYVDDILSKLLTYLGTSPATTLCAKDQLFRQKGGVACCATVWSLPAVPGCQNSAAVAEAICKGVGDFDTSGCGKAIPKAVLADPASNIKALLAKDPSGLLTKGLCSPTAKYPAGSAVEKLSTFVKNAKICPEIK